MQMCQNHLPPNSGFSSDFVHFILKMLENLKSLRAQKTFFKKWRFLSDVPYRILDRILAGGRPPHGGDVHATELVPIYYNLSTTVLIKDTVYTFKKQ